MDDVEKLVDDILERCVPGYRRPERKAKPQKLKRRATVVRDGFELESPAADGPNSTR